MIPGSDPRYAFFTTALNYAGVPQRAVVVWSEEMEKRNQKNVRKEN
jgi:transposase